MPYSFITGLVDENKCMGDTLIETINPNFASLDTGIAAASAQNIFLKTRYNTLVRSLTSIGSPGTNYNSLSSTFLSLSALIIP